MGLTAFFIFVACVYYTLRSIKRFLDDPRFNPPRRPTGYYRPTDYYTPPPPPPPAAPQVPRQRTPYEILEVTPLATPEEIRKAYQKKVAEYHPDQVAHLGSELREVAERRTKEITAAYNQLKRT